MNEDQRDLTENLPDDVLASIFSFLGSDALLDVVPVVCKRWHLLSKHPDVWRHYDLVVPPTLIKESNFLRVAKVAPRLRTLDLESVDIIYPAVETVIGFLIKGTKIVKNLHTFTRCTKKMQRHTKNLLEKFSPSLRKVKFSFSNGDCKRAKDFYAGVNELLHLISVAPRLEYLTLNFYDVANFKDYGGQLGKGCALLKRLEVKHYQAFHDDIILDVLRNKKNQLVEVGFDSELSKNVANALRDCQELHKCRVLLIDTPVVESMSQLSTLKIGLSVASLPKYAPDVENFIKSSNVLENISNLTLWTRMNFIRISFLDKVAATLNLLTLKCKNVKVFKLVEISLPSSLLDNVLTNYENLEEIWFECCAGVKDNHIQKFGKLSSLRVVSIHNLNVHSQTEIVKLNKAIEKLKLSKPNAAISLNCELSPYGAESDYDEYGTDDEDDFYDDYQFTYYDYLRNKYGDDISDMDLMALASSDDEIELL